MFKIRERLYDDMAETLQNDYFELFYVPTMIANRLLRNRFCGRSYGSVILVVHTILKNMPPCKYFILISLSVKVGRPAHSSLSVARFLLVSLVNFWQFIAIAKGRGRRMYCPFSAHLCGLRPIIISSVTYRARLNQVANKRASRIRFQRAAGPYIRISTGSCSNELKCLRPFSPVALSLAFLSATRSHCFNRHLVPSLYFFDTRN